jgi:phosphoribosylformylglycinamidine synthase
MIQNESLKFVCKDIYLSVENKNTSFTKKLTKDVIKIPVAHGDGNYFTDEETLKDLEKNNQVVFRYSSSSAKLKKNLIRTDRLIYIAGIINKKGNVLGMMPHPERACDPVLRKTDGVEIFYSIAEGFLN